uniref:Uncharacterized protein n=1 Tax=Clastoptera arizonana TaxID=38151 RepID=A0A1B6EBK2_9HEMI
MKLFGLVHFLLGISLATGLSTTIKCFQCNSWVDPDCINLQPNQTNSIHYKTCEYTGEENYSDFELFCRKIEQIIPERDNLVRIVRKCGWVIHKSKTDTCYKLANDDHTETVCQCFSDACNKAETYNININLSLAFLFIAALFSYI